jgi:DNA-binding CsgD family transcriptional regulator
VSSWRVPSLRAPTAAEVVAPAALEGFDAVRLFVDRAKRVRPNLVLDDRAAAAIVSICARLDGIPLALELAAARTRTLPLERLAAGLGNAFRLLTGGVRTAMPRQQTLLASIGWSVDLLDDVERAVLRRLSVFHGSFPLEAAEMVTADGALVEGYSVLDVIGRLVDKSLVLLDETADRYRLLETIRQFALDRLRDTGELAATRDRHAMWFADWCVSLGHGDHDFDIGPSHPMLPDVFSALDWAYESAPSLAYRMSRCLAGVRGLLGHYPEFDRQYLWLSSRDGSDDPAAWAAAVAGMSNTAMAFGRDDYIELMARAEPLLDPTDEMSRCYLRLFPATIACFAGDPAELSAFVVTAQENRDDHAVRLFTSLVAITHACSGALDRADAAIATVQRVLDRRQLNFGLDTGLGAVGVAIFTACQRGNMATARRLATISGHPDAAQVFVTAACLGLFAYATGDFDMMRRAVSWQTAAEAGVAAAEDNRMEGPALTVHCWAALLERRYDDALPLLRRCQLLVPLTPALKSYLAVPLCIRLLAIDERNEVRSLLDVLAADVARTGNPPRPLVDLHYVRALVARAEGRVDDAWQDVHAALDVAHRAGLRLAVIDALHLLAELAARRGHPTMAARLFGAVSAERARIGYTAHEVPDCEAVNDADAAVRHDEPDAAAQGAAMALDAAVSYAQRTRGERGRSTVGWSSLTPTELRVAALVAQGGTNGDIAKELIMSIATVKSHLTHIYSKLGVANRTELAARHPRS